MKFNKYHVSPPDQRTVDNITFASKAEMHRYQTLKLMVSAGAVRYFLRQVGIHLPGGVRYVCDFMVVLADGSIIYEDVKGHRTREYITKKKLVEALYPIKITEIKR